LFPFAPPRYAPGGVPHSIVNYFEQLSVKVAESFKIFESLGSTFQGIQAYHCVQGPSSKSKHLEKVTLLKNQNRKG